MWYITRQEETGETPNNNFCAGIVSYVEASLVQFRTALWCGVTLTRESESSSGFLLPYVSVPFSQKIFSFSLFLGGHTHNKTLLCWTIEGWADLAIILLKSTTQVVYTLHIIKCYSLYIDTWIAVSLWEQHQLSENRISWSCLNYEIVLPIVTMFTYISKGRRR